MRNVKSPTHLDVDRHVGSERPLESVTIPDLIPAVICSSLSPYWDTRSKVSNTGIREWKITNLDSDVVHWESSRFTSIWWMKNTSLDITIAFRMPPTLTWTTGNTTVFRIYAMFKCGGVKTAAIEKWDVTGYRRSFIFYSDFRLSGNGTVKQSQFQIYTYYLFPLFLFSLFCSLLSPLTIGTSCSFVCQNSNPFIPSTYRGCTNLYLIICWWSVGWGSNISSVT